MAQQLDVEINKDYQRHLGGFEEFFYRVSRADPVTIVIAAEIQGHSNAEQWRSAIDAVAAYRPLLRSRVSSPPAWRPYFQRTKIPLPLRILQLAQVNVADYCKNEMTTPCDPETTPWRFTVALGDGHAVLIASADHTMIDGRGMVLLVRDILNAMSGRPLRSETDISLSHDEMLGLTLPAVYRHPGNIPDNPAPQQQPSDELTLEHETIDRDLLVRVKASARAKGTTLHGALTAAALTSVSTEERWAGMPLQYVSPIDNRPILDMADYFGLCITVCHGQSDVSDRADFWSLARKIRSEIEQELPIGRAQEVMSGILSMTEDPTIEKGLDALPPFDLMVTNYGSLSIPSHYGELRLVGITPYVRSRRFAQTISIATLNDTLRMSNASYAIIPGLLRRTKSLLDQMAT